MRRELAEAVEMLMSTGAGPAPSLLVLVCEDLHVSDHSTAEWLAHLARRCREALGRRATVDTQPATVYARPRFSSECHISDGKRKPSSVLNRNGGGWSS